MTPEAQQRAIAIACGKTPSCAPDPYVDTPEFHEWRDWRTQTQPFLFRYRVCSKCPSLHLEGERYVSIPDDHAIPDYLHDLDAMNEAEKVLQNQCKYWPDYVDELLRLVTYSYPHMPGQKVEPNWSQTIHASAAQRAEAFLKAIGQWVEETESQPCQ